MTRQGDTLVNGWTSMTDGPQTARLRFTDGNHVGHLSGLSDSTAVPMLWP